MDTAETKKAEESQYPQCKWALKHRRAYDFVLRCTLRGLSFSIFHTGCVLQLPRRHRKEGLFLYAVYTNTVVYVAVNAYRGALRREMQTYIQKETKPRRSVKIIKTEHNQSNDSPGATHTHTHTHTHTFINMGQLIVKALVEGNSF